MVVAGLVDPTILEPVIQYEITAEQVSVISFSFKKTFFWRAEAKVQQKLIEPSKYDPSFIGAEQLN